LVLSFCGSSYISKSIPFTLIMCIRVCVCVCVCVCIHAFPF
jgi:hypothetical protein